MLSLRTPLVAGLTFTLQGGKKLTKATEKRKVEKKLEIKIKKSEKITFKYNEKTLNNFLNTIEFLFFL